MPTPQVMVTSVSCPEQAFLMLICEQQFEIAKVAVPVICLDKLFWDWED